MTSISQRIAELAGIAEVSFQGSSGARGWRSRPSRVDLRPPAAGRSPEAGLRAARGSQQQFLLVSGWAVTLAGLGTVGVGIGDDLVIVVPPRLLGPKKVPSIGFEVGANDVPAERRGSGRIANRVGESLGSSLIIWRIILRAATCPVVSSES